jgi:tetratricopeptide (TPR) repeat protein
MCPSADTIAALLEGRLPPREMAAVHAHAADCEICRLVIAEGVRERPPQPVLRPATRQRPALADPEPEDTSPSGDDLTSPASPASPEGEDYWDVKTHGPLPRGSSLGRYLILEHLASGGMGSVYLANDPELDRRVALKVISTTTTRVGADDLRWRLLREAQAMARVAHPNVVVVHDVGTVKDQVFLAMEYVPGLTLREWLNQRPRSWRKVLQMFAQAGRGLAAAHAQGLVHRDFKPDNVLIGSDGRARVADFGLVRPRDDGPGLARNPTLSTPLTEVGTLLGTPRYMAPEQIRGGVPDGRTDQFSYCVALYEALYRVPPFESDPLHERLAQIERGAFTPPPTGHQVPDAVGAAVRRGLHADRARRFRTMDDLVDLLESYQHGPRAGRRIAAAATVVLALGGGAAAVVSLRPWQGSGAGPGADSPPAQAAAVAPEQRDDARVEALRRQVAAARVLVEAGRAQEALPQAEQAASAASGLNAPGLEASAYLELGRARAELRRPAEAAEAFHRAAAAALLARDDASAARAWLGLAELSAADASRAPDAPVWASYAAGAISRAGNPPHLEGMLRHRMGLIALRNGQVDVASGHLRAALALLEQALGKDHLALAEVLDADGEAARGAGRLDEAAAQLTRALALRRAALGPEHRLAVPTLLALAAVESDRGQLAASAGHLVSAAQILERAHGPDDARTARVRVALASTRAREGRWEDAGDLARMALPALEASTPAEPLLTAEGELLAGRASLVRGDAAGAASLLERAIRRLGAAGPEGQARLPLARAALAHARLGMGQIDGAVESLERARLELAARGGGGFERAYAAFLLARALAGRRAEAARVRALAAEARKARQEAAMGEAEQMVVDPLDRWLADRRF